MTKSGQKRRNVHYFNIFTYYLNTYEKNTPDGVGSEDHPTQGRCTLFHGLCPCTLMENLLEKGLYKGCGCGKTFIIFVFKFCSSYSISMRVHRLNLFTLYSMIHSQVLYLNVVYLAVKMFLKIKLTI